MKKLEQDHLEPKFKVGDKVFIRSHNAIRVVIQVSTYGTYWVEGPNGGSGWWYEADLELYNQKY